MRSRSPASRRSVLGCMNSVCARACSRKPSGPAVGSPVVPVERKVEAMAKPQESQGSQVQVSEAQIAVHWREEEYYQPPPKFVEQANAADPAIFERFSEEHFPDCFTEYADLLAWDK